MDKKQSPIWRHQIDRGKGIFYLSPFLYSDKWGLPVYSIVPLYKFKVKHLKHG